MLRLIKSEFYKLYYSFDNAGFMIIGSILAILFSVVVQIYSMGNDFGSVNSIFAINTLGYSFYGVLILVVILQTYFIGKAFRSRMICYEIMHGHKMSNIIISRILVVSVSVALFFIIVMSIYIYAMSIIGDFPEDISVAFLFKKLMLMLIIIFRLAMVTAMYIIVIKNDIMSIGFSMLMQCIVIPKVLEVVFHQLTNAQDRYEEVCLWLSSKQMMALQLGDSSNALVKYIILGMVIEVVITFVVTRSIYKFPGKRCDR